MIFSAVLAAGAPDMAPFMADECLLAMPDIEGRIACDWTQSFFWAILVSNCGSLLLLPILYNLNSKAAYSAHR